MSLWQFLMSINNCRPVRYFWDASVKGECGFMSSWFYFSTCIVHVLIDICIMAIPVKQIMKLHLPVSQKIGATAMFLFGLL